MKQVSEIEAEYTHKDIDQRLAKRLLRIGKLLHTNPSSAFGSITQDEAEKKGFYRFVNHKKLLPTDTHTPHREQTIQRAEQHETILAIHDTTDMDFTLYLDQSPRLHLARLSNKKQGYSCHTTFLVGEPPVPEPLGVFRFLPYVHEKYIDSEEMRNFWEKYGDVFENESRRWSDAINATEEVFPKGKLLHVMDRESDTYSMLVELQEKKQRFVLRHRMDRKLADGSWFEDAWEDVDVVGEKIFTIQRRLRSHDLPKNDKTNYRRESRQVHVKIQSRCLQLKRSQDPPKGTSREEWKKAPQSIAVNVVHAKEVNAPEGAKEVEWYLLTSEPIRTEADCLRVIEIYDTRWLIEELFKSLKTGCGYEKRQEESATSLLQMLALSWAQAWWLLRLRFLNEHTPEAGTSHILEDWEEKLLKAATPKYKWSRKTKVSDVLGALAYLGGHYTSKKPPGWVILGRGYQKFLGMCEAVSLYRNLVEV